MTLDPARKLVERLGAPSAHNHFKLQGVAEIRRILDRETPDLPPWLDELGVDVKAGRR